MTPRSRTLPTILDETPTSWIPVGGKPRRITRKSEILDIALGLAADHGDQAPALIQHVACTRAEANRAMCGAVVPGDRTSWLIAIQGQFTARHHLRRRFQPADAEVQQFSVIMLVVDAANGAPTDSGHSNDYPDLAAVGPVTTDYIAIDA